MDDWREFAHSHTFSPLFSYSGMEVSLPTPPSAVPARPPPPGERTNISLHMYMKSSLKHTLWYWKHVPIQVCRHVFCINKHAQSWSGFNLSPNVISSLWFLNEEAALIYSQTLQHDLRCVTFIVTHIQALNMPGAHVVFTKRFSCLSSHIASHWYSRLKQMNSDVAKSLKNYKLGFYYIIVIH